MVFEVSRANEKQADGGGTEKACQSRLLERNEDMRFVGVCQEVVAASGILTWAKEGMQLGRAALR
jgi:hypothetical protein